MEDNTHRRYSHTYFTSQIISQPSKTTYLLKSYFLKYPPATIPFNKVITFFGQMKGSHKLTRTFSIHSQCTLTFLLQHFIKPLATS